MAINDRRGAATMTHRRNFLVGIASLIVAPAVVKADILMPILVWRPTFSRTRAMGMPLILAYTSDLEGVDLASLGLPAAHWRPNPDIHLWNELSYSLESLPRDRIRIDPRTAALVAASTNHRIGGVALATSRAGSPPG
jgi:hypothetical protein